MKYMFRVLAMLALVLTCSGNALLEKMIAMSLVRPKWASASINRPMPPSIAVMTA